MPTNQQIHSRFTYVGQQRDSAFPGGIHNMLSSLEQPRSARDRGIFSSAILFSISSGSGSCFRACVLISVNYYTFHPTQRGVDLLDAEERTDP